MAIAPPSQLSIRAALGFALRATVANLGLWLAVMVLSAIALSPIPMAFTMLLSESGVYSIAIILGLSSFFLVPLVGLGLTRVALQVCDDSAPKLSDVLPINTMQLITFAIDTYAYQFIRSTMYSFATIPIAFLMVLVLAVAGVFFEAHSLGDTDAGLGAALLGLAIVLIPLVVVVGGFMLGVHMLGASLFGLYGYCAIAENTDPIDSLNQVMDLTQGNRWRIAWLFAIVSLCNALGVLCLGLGLLVTIPFGAIAKAHVYRQLQPLTPDTSDPALSSSAS